MAKRLEYYEFEKWWPCRHAEKHHYSIPIEKARAIHSQNGEHTEWIREVEDKEDHS